MENLLVWIVLVAGLIQKCATCPTFLKNQIYPQLECKEILDSLTYYKQVSRLGNLHGHLHGHLHGSVIKLAYTQLMH